MKSFQTKEKKNELDVLSGGYFTRNKQPIYLLRIGQSDRGFVLDTVNGFSHADFFVSGVNGKTAFNQQRQVLVDASANSIFTVDLPVSKFCGGRINWECIASDGTDVQCRTGITTFSGVNKAGTITTDVDEIGGSVAVSAGTLTGTWGVSNGVSKIVLQFTPTSSLTPTTLSLYYSYESFTRVIKV